MAMFVEIGEVALGFVSGTKPCIGYRLVNVIVLREDHSSTEHGTATHARQPLLVYT